MKRDQTAKLYPKYGYFLLSKVLGRYPRPRPKMSGMYSCIIPEMLLYADTAIE